TVSTVALVWSGLLLIALLVSGASAAMRDVALSAASSVSGTFETPLSIVVYVLLLVAVSEAARFPLDLYGGFVLERRYGLSTENLRGWLTDACKGTALSAALSIVAALVVYFFIRRFATLWWLPAGVTFSALIVGLANLGPVLLLPLFYAIRPLEHESLRVRLMRLADRAGARVLGAYEWGLSAKTKKANAALTGLGATRRILVSDTMLADYSEDEIEVVLAHELAHHVHGDIWKGILFETVLVMAGCFVAAKSLSVGVPLFGLTGVDDVAGVPLLLLAAGAVSVLLLPLAHALSRRHERKADRFALELTGNPAAFVSAMKRLSQQSLAEEDPGKVVEWLFYSHPPTRERIAAAKEFAASR
ncbi:MAG: M48 family metallopeptidase, partial [Acidobacteriaceae bacterium]|nr:M48 family metallopeptidase [Acidobacteriaceae bacterium]